MSKTLVKDAAQDGFVPAVFPLHPSSQLYLPSCWSPTSNRRVMHSASFSFSRVAVSLLSLFCWLRCPGLPNYSLCLWVMKLWVKFQLTSFREWSSWKVLRAPEPLWHKHELWSHRICKDLSLDFRIFGTGGVCLFKLFAKCHFHPMHSGND